jgi:hypothetical protein
MDNNENNNEQAIADYKAAEEMLAATYRRQAQLDELEILSRHLADPDNNPL